MKYARKEDIARYQAMAEECRSTADDVYMSETAKANLLKCADGYECMARAAAQIAVSKARLDEK